MLLFRPIRVDIMKKRKIKIAKNKRKNTQVKTQLTSLIVGSLATLFILGVFSSFVNTKISHIAKPTPAAKTQESAIKAIADPVLSKTPVVKKQTLPLGKGEVATYTVKDNDSLSKIGKMYCNSDRAYLDIAEKNNIYSPYTLHTGDVLTVSCQ